MPCRRSAMTSHPCRQEASHQPLCTADSTVVPGIASDLAVRAAALRNWYRCGGDRLAAHIRRQQGEDGGRRRDPYKLMALLFSFQFSRRGDLSQARRQPGSKIHPVMLSKPSSSRQPEPHAGARQARRRAPIGVPSARQQAAPVSMPSSWNWIAFMPPATVGTAATLWPHAMRAWRERRPAPRIRPRAHCLRSRPAAPRPLPAGSCRDRSD